MLEGLTYSPILHTRLSEMRGLLQLPSAAKDLMFPLFIARPWPNSPRLSMTWEKIREAVGERRFAIDLDQTKRGSPGKQPAADDFSALCDPEYGYKSFYDAVGNLPYAIPVLQTGNVIDQIPNIDRLDRGVVFRITQMTTRLSDTLDRLIANLADVLFVVDVGWSNDVLSQELWASSIIQAIATRKSDPEIVVSASSFPDEFTSVKARGTKPIREKILFNNLVRRHNLPLIYGDWGSTRPPRDSTPMTSVPRLDLANEYEWIFFRRTSDEDDDEDYRAIARRLVDDPAFIAQPNIWSTYAIRCTADNLPGAIRSGSVAASARINLHLHKQAFQGGVGYDDEVEPFTDD